MSTPTLSRVIRSSNYDDHNAVMKWMGYTIVLSCYTLVVIFKTMEIHRSVLLLTLLRLNFSLFGHKNTQLNQSMPLIV